MEPNVPMRQKSSFCCHLEPLFVFIDITPLGVREESKFPILLSITFYSKVDPIFKECTLLKNYYSFCFYQVRASQEVQSQESPVYFCGGAQPSTSRQVSEEISCIRMPPFTSSVLFPMY